MAKKSTKKSTKKSAATHISNSKFGCVEYSEMHADAVRDVAQALNINAQALLNLSKVLNGSLTIEGPLLQVNN